MYGIALATQQIASAIDRPLDGAPGRLQSRAWSLRRSTIRPTTTNTQYRPKNGMNRNPAAFAVEKSSRLTTGRNAYFLATRNGDARPNVRKWTRISSSTENVA